MIEQLLRRKIEERIEKLAEVLDRVDKELFKEYYEVLERGGRSLRGLEEMVLRIHKQLLDCLSLIEKIVKLKQELQREDELSEVARALAYGIMKLDEQARLKVVQLIRDELAKMESEDEGA